jgi:asparagine synthase (glutamine-hydrolysing)
MMRALTAHGPDGSDIWHDASVALGHQMMYITPESSGETLPLHHAASGISITADARLDNREELVETLGIGSTQTLPDTQLILAAYQKWGIACVEHFIGEFNIAIWDAGEQKLHCITDPMGIRPLFHIQVEDGCFAFASEIMPLLEIVKNPSINQRRIAMLGVSALTGYLETTRTGFEKIYRVPPASILTVSRPGISSSEYWRPDPGKRLHFKSDGDCAEAFREVLLKSVKSRMRSAYPVGALLSGGLDSSAVVGAANQVLTGKNKSLVTLSSLPELTSKGRVADEEAFIELFREYSNLQMVPVRATGHGPFENLEELVKTGSLGSYGFQHYMYSALVRTGRKHGARILLDGYGGELSASTYLRGYFSEMLLRGRFGEMFKQLKGLSSDGRISKASVKRNVLRPLVPYRLLKAMNRHRRFENLAVYPVRKEFVRDVLGKELDSIEDQLFELLSLVPDHRKNMARNIVRARQDIRQRSHAGYINYEEARFSYPYLDKRVLEFALAVDGRYKLKDGQDRRLIRIASRGLVPGEVRNRASKAAFCPDYHIRYTRQKAAAAESFLEFSREPELSRLVDFEEVFKALENQSQYDPEKPMAVDYDSQFLVPYAMFLCYFLDHFNS